MAKFLKASWENLIMANYAVDPKLLQPYLPKGLELDFYRGKTYVSLVGFLFRHSRIFEVPIPMLGTFEEINLRFYVVRKSGDKIKRGVVFINETVPYRLVAWMANRLYKEHYTAIPTKHRWQITAQHKHIEYQWKINQSWGRMIVEASAAEQAMETNSIEEFIFEHYYGYTKISGSSTEEYKIEHPRWDINKVNNYTVDCDFEAMYGKDFGYLSAIAPDSIMLAQGSSIAVEWKRNTI